MTAPRLGQHRAPRQPRRFDGRDLASIGLIALGGMLLLSELGLPVGPWTWPVVMGAVGVAVITRTLDDETAAEARDLANRLPGRPADALLADRSAWLRMGIGALFVFGGVASALATADALPALRQGVIAFIGVVGGVAVILGPWLLRLGRELTDERRARIRADERDQVAAHLHDSVLQTLALIQRSAASGDDVEVARLARRQERDLRRWLFADGHPTTGDTSGSLAASLRRSLDDIEDDHRVRVELVTVGDMAVDDVGRAVVGALTEAVRNAAKHAGVSTVDAYLEVTDAAVSASARDRGAGFDVGAASGGPGQGLERSIRQRIARVGGRVEVVSSVGEGTEVDIEVPRGPRP